MHCHPPRHTNETPMTKQPICALPKRIVHYVTLIFLLHPSISTPLRRNITYTIFHPSRISVPVPGHLSRVCVTLRWVVDVTPWLSPYFLSWGEMHDEVMGFCAAVLNVCVHICIWYPVWTPLFSPLAVVWVRLVRCLDWIQLWSDNCESCPGDLGNFVMVRYLRWGLVRSGMYFSTVGAIVSWYAVVPWAFFVCPFGCVGSKFTEILNSITSSASVPTGNAHVRVPVSRLPYQFLFSSRIP